MRRLWNVLFWSVIAAAFIGPGTVTTAASAGARHGNALLWALVFSTVACLSLQEAAARLTAVSGRTLGSAIRRRYGQGLAGAAAVALVVGAVVLGCAAYEAGNILGGAAGALLGIGVGTRPATLFTVLVAALLLATGRTTLVARALGLLVAVMGVAFIATACMLTPSIGDLLRGSLVPAVPRGSGLLVLGLVGTTVVPYNLFLGSGLAAGQGLGELRFGLAVSIVLGGLISMAILVVGTAVDGPFGFDALAEVLTLRLGPWARRLFGLGLFAAGVSSAVTAPLAAAVTTRSLFASPDDPRWTERSWRQRTIWGGVLAVGLGFGLAGVRPVPAILVAQALNGVLLPFVAVFLLLAVNDVQLLGPRHVNGLRANALMIPVVAVTLLLGVSGLLRAAATAAGVDLSGGVLPLLVALAITAAIGQTVARRIVTLRRRGD